MGIRSFSQNFEDVLLFRALGHIEHGFYIDVGAADPVTNSVTKAFYDRGWSGVNLEPVGESWQRLEMQRPRDVNLNIALGESHGEAVLHVDPTWADISTLDSEALIASGRDPALIRQVTVPVWTLSEVCDRFARPVIHFLKVDVEGLELQVLRGGDFTVYRPWVTVVEVQSLDRRSQSDGLEQYMQSADYRPVYFDGLNRFFVSAEMHGELHSAFLEPVSVKDDFVIAAAEQEMAALSALSELLGASSVRADEIYERVSAVIADRYMAVKAADSAESQRQELVDVRTELDHAYQEIYELSRHIGSLTTELNNAVEAMEPVARRLEEETRGHQRSTMELQGMAAETEVMAAELARTRGELESFVESKSWRVTAPMRKAKDHLRALRAHR